MTIQTRHRLLCLAILCYTGSVAAEPRWTVTPVALVPHGDSGNAIELSASNGLSTVTIVADVVLTSITDTFLFKDKFVISGEAGKASAVVIVDLPGKAISDWFFCKEARRVSDSWIALIEWYPDHGMRWPTDVVAVYDVNLSAQENRLPGADSKQFPSDVHNSPVRVGFPVYPHDNSMNGSYSNIVSESKLAVSILGEPYFALLPSHWLVFVAAHGKEFSDSSNVLVVVDFSNGLLKAPSKTVEIPTREFKTLGENPRLIEVSAIVPLGPESVRLLVPKAKYGVESIVVDLAVGLFY